MGIADEEIHLHVETTGDGLPVVLTHGLGESSATWGAVLDRLAARHRVVRWDLRGHGGSATPDDPAAYSRDLAQGDLRHVVEQQGEPVGLVGHSLGGYLSLALALRYPELVRGLVLISSGPGFRDQASRADWNRYVDRVATRMPIPAPASRLCHQPDSWVIDELPALSRPLLQIVGGDDTRFHAGVAYVHRTVPASTVVTVTDAGHHPQQTNPDEVATAIEHHLAAG